MKVFKAKVGYVLFIPVLTVLLTSVIYPVYKSENLGVPLIMLVIMAPIVYMVLAMFLNTTYKISEENKLEIKCGFILNTTVDIECIKSVKKTNSLISSPAPSLDRIEIAFGKFDAVIISPVDKVALVKELLKINPNIKTSII